MAFQRATTFAERDQFVRLHAAGLTYREIGERMGWKPGTARKHCRAARQVGEEALYPHKPGPPKQGPLSTFDPVVRFAALRLKLEHPAWGPAVIIDELGQRPSTRNKRLPHVSQLAAYYQQFGDRLVQPRRHLQLPPAPSPLDPVADRLVFQLDIQERLFLPQLGHFNVLNIRAPQWGVTVGSYPHPAGERRWTRKVSLEEARDDCRQTFERWGLPDVLQMDRDKVLVTTGEYPFPSLFTLWLVGLGIEHRLIQRVTQNGSVERCHRTFDKQMLSGPQCDDWPTFKAYVASELERLNERIPSRAKACRGQPPLVAHPEARIPRRPYHQEREAELFNLRRVYAYLAGGRWVRHTTVKGQFKFADHFWTLGSHLRRLPIIITFTPETLEFIVSSPEGQELKRLPSDWLTEASIRGLPG